MSEQDCRDANVTSWEGVGQADGQAGWEANQRLEMHYDACAKVGIRPNRDSYLKGWYRGIFDYCTPDRGYSIGLSGYYGNSAVCPGDTGRLFQANVELGQHVYHLKDEISSVENEIRSLEKKLDDKKLDRETIRDLHIKIRHRDGELSRLRSQLTEAQSRPLIR